MNDILKATGCASRERFYHLSKAHKLVIAYVFNVRHIEPLYMEALEIRKHVHTSL